MQKIDSIFTKNLAFRTLGIYDFAVAGFAAAVCLVVYFLTLTPSISSGDNGELTVAANFLGVAHAPAYPIHSIFAKLVTFVPYKNIAWRVNFFSALSSALLVFFSCLVYIKILYAQRFKRNPTYLASACAAISLGLSQIVWGQSTIAEVYTPSSVFFPILTLILISWHQQMHARKYGIDSWNQIVHEAPNSKLYLGNRFIYALALVFGFALGGHHTVLMLILFLSFYLFAIWNLYTFPQLSPKNEKVWFPVVCVVLLCYALAWVLYYRYIMDVKSNIFSNNFSQLKFGLGVFIAINAALVLFYCYQIWRDKGKPESNIFSKRLTLLTISAFIFFYLGFSVYIYLFIRSHANPPINWGGISESSSVTEKIAKFFHVVHRKQYGSRKYYYTFFNLLNSFKVSFVPIHSLQLSYPLWILTFVGAITMFFRSKLFFILIAVGIITYNLQLTLFLRIYEETRIFPLINIFYICSIYLIAAFLASGFALVFQFIHQTTKRLIIKE